MFLSSIFASITERPSIDLRSFTQLTGYDAAALGSLNAQERERNELAPAEVYNGLSTAVGAYRAVLQALVENNAASLPPEAVNLFTAKAFPADPAERETLRQFFESLEKQIDSILDRIYRRSSPVAHPIDLQQIPTMTQSNNAGEVFTLPENTPRPAIPPQSDAGISENRRQVQPLTPAQISARLNEPSLPVRHDQHTHAGDRIDQHEDLEKRKHAFLATPPGELRH